VNVEDALPRVTSGIRNDPVTGLIDPLRPGEFACGGEDLTQDVGMVVRELGPVGDVVLGDDQDVGWRGGIDVAKRNDLPAVQNYVGRNLTPNDLAEETVLRHVREFMSRGARPGANSTTLTRLLNLGNDVGRRDRVADVGFGRRRGEDDTQHFAVGANERSA
jgi:hypothetical protein